MANIKINEYADVRRLLQETGFSENDMPLFGKNEDGEVVILSTLKDIEDGSTAYKIQTAQGNGWMRVTIYYKDGTVEELYER